MERSKRIKRIIAVCAAVFVIAAFVLSVFTKGFTDWRFWKEQRIVNDLNSNVVITPQDSNGGLRLMAEFQPEITPGGTEEENASKSLSITATLSPVTAENKTIHWSVAWQDAESEWAGGKDVSDYLTLGAESSQSGESVLLNCVDDFGEKIIVTAKAEADESIFASCNVDFRKKIESVQYSFKKGGETMAAPSAEADGVYRVDYTGEEKAYTVECTPVYSDYTLDDEYTQSITGGFAETFGYGEGISLTKIELQAGLYGGGAAEPELSAEAEDFISRVVTSCTIGNWNACMASATAARNVYDTLPEEQQNHSKVANAYEAVCILMENLGDQRIDSGDREEAQAILDSYEPPKTDGDFTGGIKIESEDALLTAAKACGDAGKGIAEFTVTYKSEYIEYRFPFAIGYTEESVTAARSMNMSLPSVVF